MNKKKNGFTVVELLATLVLLGIIMGLVLVTVNTGFGNAKDKTEDVFIKTIEDALNMYLDSDARSLRYTEEVCTLNKTHGSVKVYKHNGNITFNNVINSSYKPITESNLVNPANEKVTCESNAAISVYRDEDFVYYYKVNKSSFNCLKTTGNITNLPSGCDN